MISSKWPIQRTLTHACHQGTMDWKQLENEAPVSRVVAHNWEADPASKRHCYIYPLPCSNCRGKRVSYNPRWFQWRLEKAVRAGRAQAGRPTDPQPALSLCVYLLPFRTSSFPSLPEQTVWPPCPCPVFGHSRPFLTVCLCTCHAFFGKPFPYFLTLQTLTLQAQLKCPI